VFLEASPDGYKETGSFQVATDGQAWAHPVVVGGRLYLREGDSLYCYEVREKSNREIDALSRSERRKLCCWPIAVDD
jgi:hypothetical protein